MNQKWNNVEKNFIRNNAKNMTDAALAEKLTGISGRNVTKAAVRKVRQRMGIAKASGRGVCRLRMEK